MEGVKLSIVLGVLLLSLDVLLDVSFNQFFLVLVEQHDLVQLCTADLLNASFPPSPRSKNGPSWVVMANALASPLCCVLAHSPALSANEICGPTRLP